MTTRAEETAVTLSRPRAVRLIALLALASSPAVISARTVAHTAARFAIDGPGPDWSELLLAFVWTPLVCLSAVIFLLGPGLIAALALNLARGAGHWLLSAFAITLPTLSVAAAALQKLFSDGLTGGRFTMLVAGLGAIASALLLWACPRRTISWTIDRPDQRTMLAWIVGGSALVLVVLLPKFAWESFNGDGAHTLESSRLLLRQVVPFWDPLAGTVSAWPGTTTMLFTYPISWFIRLFGPVEAAARLPLLLYLALLAAGLGMLANRSGRVLGHMDNALIWGALLTFTIAMAFSATYSPYSADIALSLSQDVLVTAMIVAVVAFGGIGSWRMAGVFAVLAHLTAPNGLLLLMLWGLSLFIVSRRREEARVRREIAMVTLAVFACLALSLALPLILSLFGLPRPGVEHDSAGILRRLAYIQVADFRRFIFMIVPGGILPALSILFWRRMPTRARAIALTAIGYFFFFYFQAYLALHHFIPAMLLPLAAFWSGAVPLEPARRKPLRAAAAVCIAAAFVVSLPRVWGIDTTPRTIGGSIDNRLEGYERSDPGLFGKIEVLTSLFPFDWDERVPREALGGSPLVWNYYSFNSPRQAQPAYLVADDSAPSPAGAYVVDHKPGIAVYVLDSAAWRRDLAIRPPTPAGSPAYQVERWVMFRTMKPEGSYRVIALGDLARRLGLRRDSRVQPDEAAQRAGASGTSSVR
jgi:hypothetical protein